MPAALPLPHLCVCALGLAAALAQPAFAQSPAGAADNPGVRISALGATFDGQPARDDMPLFRDLFAPLPGDVARMASRSNWFLVAAGSAATLVSHPADTSIAASGWGAGAVHEALEPGAIVGSFAVQTGSALVTYAIGRVTNRPRVATVGARLFRAQLVAQGATQAIKLTAQRTRPDGTPLSLPSGHTSSAFATATVVQREFGWKAGVPAYAIASWVAASRVQMDRHYLSDVIAGATIGILAGRSVTVGHGAARFSVAPMVVPGGIGVGFVKVSGQ